MVACHRKLKLMTGTSNTELAQEISDVLGTPLVKSAVTRFSDGEIRTDFRDGKRGGRLRDPVVGKPCA